jgi:hypothetical protein
MANAKAGRSAVKIGRTTAKLGRKRAGIKIIQKTALQNAEVYAKIAEI